MVEVLIVGPHGAYFVRQLVESELRGKPPRPVVLFPFTYTTAYPLYPDELARRIPETVAALFRVRGYVCSLPGRDIIYNEIRLLLDQVLEYIVGEILPDAVVVDSMLILVIDDLIERGYSVTLAVHEDELPRPPILELFRKLLMSRGRIDRGVEDMFKEKIGMSFKEILGLNRELLRACREAVDRGEVMFGGVKIVRLEKTKEIIMSVKMKEEGFERR